jgi:hypothetical protein
MPSKKKTPAKKKAPPVAAAATCSPLTVDILKTLKFGLRMHLNGGENYSSRIDGNDEYKLRVETHTNGSPDYRITSKTLGVDDAPEIELDLMAKDRDLQAFCDAYNSRANESSAGTAPEGEAGQHSRP